MRTPKTTDDSCNSRELLESDIGLEERNRKAAGANTKGLDSNQPKPYGLVHSELQQVDSPVRDIASLRRHLGTDDPFCNWTTIDEDGSGDISRTSDFFRWFPCDDQVVFYAPVQTTTHDQAKYEYLTYRELHHQLQQCPPFGPPPSRIAIVIPVDQMADMAVALLSVVAQGAVAVPLDPRMTTNKILEAVDQLNCTCLVATESILLEKNILQSRSDKSSSSSSEYYTTHPSLVSMKDDNKSQWFRQVNEIRVVNSGMYGCGRIHWTCLQKKDQKWTLYNPQMTEHAPVSSTLDTDLSILLRTSGTTSKPKVVPISRSMLLYGALCIATALKLKRQDCNANSMPFYHIGGISCNLLAVLVSGGKVLFAGPLKDPQAFLDHILTKEGKNDPLTPKPTWLYQGPSMHKALVLTAEKHWHANGKEPPPNQLRFVRSASAHLNHDLALRLSTIFACQVIPTYGMSEAMPICSSAPIDVRNNPPCEVVDSVGYTAGTSVRIMHPDKDETLPFPPQEKTLADNLDDYVGEICVKGAGVISQYIGLDVNKTHTTGGWLRTGDCGILDRQGRLFIKGRSKEMIKRGGEQVWPNEIDDVVENVPGVATAVTFGVPNELWGEEVAVAVVLKEGNPANKGQLEEQILQTCRNDLGALSVPNQIIVLSSEDDLPRGSTGKYLRSKMASNLGVTAVDTGALRLLASPNEIKDSETAATAEGGKAGKYHWMLQLLETKSEEGRRVVPSDALNGVRFLVACFIVQVHVGLFPNMTWVKLQGFVPNMMIFFSLAGFQTTCQIASSVKDQWASFVGTKIGALHSLFVICQLFTFPSYVLFRAFDEDGNLAWTIKDWVLVSIRFVFATITGLGMKYDVNMFTWFQSTFYIFLIAFPWVDHYLRRLKLKTQCILFVIFAALSSLLWFVLFIGLPYDIFWSPGVYDLGWTIVTWFPLLIASVLAAYLFRRVVEYYWDALADEDTSESEENEQQPIDPDTIDVESVKSRTKIVGYICDLVSFVLLMMWVIVAAFPTCICVHGETFQEMRPDEELPPDGECPFKNQQYGYVWTCDITYGEWVDHILPDPNHVEYGRLPTNWSGAAGYLRCTAALFLFWIATMAFGQGYTCRLFESKIMTRLAPLGYPLYLVHMAVTRYYWIATRGLEREYWFGREGEFPFPVEWYEFFLLLFLSVLVGFLIDTFLAPLLMPYTISWGVGVCNWISGTLSRRFGSCFRSSNGSDEKKIHAQHPECSRLDLASPTATSSYDKIATMSRGLTGMNLTADIPLRHMGLDSMGAAALLGMLRSAVPTARNLTLQQLQTCDTISSLVHLLDGVDSATTPPDPSAIFSSKSHNGLA